MKAEQIERINQLARKARTEGLSKEEKLEQAQLRAEYLAAIRRNFSATLDNTYIQRPDGSTAKLQRRTEAEPAAANSSPGSAEQDGFKRIRLNKKQLPN